MANALTAQLVRERADGLPSVAGENWVDMMGALPVGEWHRLAQAERTTVAHKFVDHATDQPQVFVLVIDATPMDGSQLTQIVWQHTVQRTVMMQTLDPESGPWEESGWITDTARARIEKLRTELAAQLAGGDED